MRAAFKNSIVIARTLIRVIDDAGEIRVLVIDPHRHDVAAVADFAVERNFGHRPISTAPVS
jgi:phosphoribosylpyrophosphate synthetase